MAIQREEGKVSAAIALHNLRVFDEHLAQPPLTHAELSAALRASFPTGLQVDMMFLLFTLVCSMRH